MKSVWLALLSVGFLWAQSFDVASVKPAANGTPFLMSPLTGGKFTAHNVDAWSLVRAAYRVLDYQISGAPNWLQTERYDIDAKSDQPADAAQTRLMLQSLLADRFHVKIRLEQKEMHVLALTAGKSIKLTPADATGCDLDPIPANPCGNLRRSAGFVVTGERVTMAQFAVMLSALFRQAVKDETGLTGVFDFKLDLVAAGFTPTAPSPSSEMDGMNAVMSGLQDQLGLKLERTRSTVEMLVIEHVERPSAN